MRPSAYVDGVRMRVRAHAHDHARVIDYASIAGCRSMDKLAVEYEYVLRLVLTLTVHSASAAPEA